MQIVNNFNKGIVFGVYTAPIQSQITISVYKQALAFFVMILNNQKTENGITSVYSLV